MRANSYSHYFKKVRLRRLTWKKDSVTSLTMAAQKSSLAILDSEGDPDMKKRVRLTPLIYLGPVACIPLIVIGVLLDMFVVASNDGRWTILLTVIGLAFYLLSFVMSLLVLKTNVTNLSFCIRQNPNPLKKRNPRSPSLCGSSAAARGRRASQGRFSVKRR